MAKGDSANAQNQINYQGGLAQNTLNNQQNRANDLYGSMYNNWQQGMNSSLKSYDEIMNNYRNFQNQASQFGLNPADRANVDESIGRYRNFADTGGFTPRNIQDLRARAIAPTRAAFSAGKRNVERSNTLAGGNLSNAPAALAKMSREQAYAASDANTNANAAIAQAIQQGKLAGTQGLAATSLAEQNQQMLADQIRNQLGLAGNQGMASLYSANPGLATTFGNQVLNASAQQNQLAQLQNQLGLGLIDAQIRQSQIPGNFQQGLGNISGVLGLLGQGAGALSKIGGIGKSPTTPGTGPTSPTADSLAGVTTGPTGSYTSGLNGPIEGMQTYDPVTGAPTSPSTPWWQQILGTSPGNQGPMWDMTSPYFWSINNPNAAQMNPYIGSVFGAGGGTSGGQGGFKGGAGGAI